MLSSMRRLFVVGLGALVASACDPEVPKGGLVVHVSGLPAGAQAIVHVSSIGTKLAPFSATISQTQTLELSPGSYAIRIDTVNAGALYAGPWLVDTAIVTIGAHTRLDAKYPLASGTIALALNGLPLGTPARLVFTGTGDYVRDVSAAM